MKAKTVKEVLAAAEWLLTNIGWTQGAGYRDKEGKRLNVNKYSPVNNLPQIRSMCLLGALYLVEATGATYIKAVRLLEDVGHTPVMMLNDRQGQTLQGVLKVIRKAKRM